MKQNCPAAQDRAGGKHNTRAGTALWLYRLQLLRLAFYKSDQFIPADCPFYQEKVKDMILEFINSVL